MMYGEQCEESAISACKHVQGQGPWPWGLCTPYTALKHGGDHMEQSLNL